MGIRNTNNDLINDKASIVRTKKLIERFFIFWLYLLDTIFFYKLRFRKALSRYELIILDRYPIIDGISYLWFHGLNPYFVSRFYLKAFPRPSIVLCLKTSPEVAFGRRKDMGLIRLKIYDMLLKTILDRIITRHYDVNVIYIDAHYPIEQVHRQIVKELQITIDI
jgi:thymidylate kinase